MYGSKFISEIKIVKLVTWYEGINTYSLDESSSITTRIKCLAEINHSPRYLSKLLWPKLV